MTKIFIDGEAGTTGLQILDRLKNRREFELLHLTDNKRKDKYARAEMLNAADVCILCLPEDASRDAINLIQNDTTKVIDASIAFRTDPDWDYGFPEYRQNQPEIIYNSKRVSNPGCYACASVAIIYPLVAAGILPNDFPITINAVSGYSGGGKSLIRAFEEQSYEEKIDAPFYLYGLGLAHKHTPEIKKWSGLRNSPLFVPSVGRFYQGMLVSVPLQLWQLSNNVKASMIHEVLSQHYLNEEFIKVQSLSDSQHKVKLDPEELNGTNELRLSIFTDASEDQAVVCAQLDNLGKGASGQAIQNLNVMLGLKANSGLT